MGGVKAPDADILGEILELLRARINAGRATFFFKVKSHRGEALNERADTLAEMGRERPEEEKRWDQRSVSPVPCGRFMCLSQLCLACLFSERISDAVSPRLFRRIPLFHFKSHTVSGIITIKDGC